MLAIAYLRRSQTHLAQFPGPLVHPAAGPVFEAGAAWMGAHLARLRGWPLPPLGPRARFTYYGWLKYGLSVGGLSLAGAALSRAGWWWPLAGLGFYLVEIQFLFLFPVLLEGRARPLRTSWQLTARVGWGRCLLGVLPVAGYMLAGLLRPGRALRHWHVGCLAILLWYVDETPPNQ